MKEFRLAERMAAVVESATLALNATAKQLASEGRTIYNLTAGELATDTPPYIQEAVAKTLNLNKYTPVAGLSELREQIAFEARSFYGLDWINAENVVVTGGAKPALYASLLALVNPGDEVIVPTPAWLSYNHLIGLTGGKVVEVPLSEVSDINAAAILAKLTPRTRVIIINSPHNPTGAVFSTAALKELAEGLKGRSIAVISDDIYARLVYDDNFTPTPTCGFDNLVIINGFSKSQALTGWRIGYAIADKVVAQAITALLSHITGNAALPSQEAGLAAMARHDRPPEETLAALKRQRQTVCEELDQIKGVKYRAPGGAFYVFLDIRQLTDNDVEWCQRLLSETGVALVPGEAFSAPGFARLTFVTDDDILRQALKQLKQFIEKEIS